LRNNCAADVTGASDDENSIHADPLGVPPATPGHSTQGLHLVVGSRRHELPTLAPTAPEVPPYDEILQHLQPVAPAVSARRVSEGRGGDEKAERHARGFTCWGHFVAMLFCQLAAAHSRRPSRGYTRTGGRSNSSSRRSRRTSM
jgi:hypothetical protein